MDTRATQILQAKTAAMSPGLDASVRAMNVTPLAPPVLHSSVPAKIMPAIPTGPSALQHFQNSASQILSSARGALHNLAHPPEAVAHAAQINKQFPQ